MNLSKTQGRESLDLAGKSQIFNDHSLALDLSQLENSGFELGQRNHGNVTQFTDYSKTKTKTRVNELGTLGTLKNLSKILSLQENSLNQAKSVKQLPIGMKMSAEYSQAQLPPQASLNSHQLHMKQKDLVRNETEMGMLVQSAMMHRPSNSSQINLGNHRQARGVRQTDNILDRSSTSFQKVLNNTLSGPMLQTSMHPKKGGERVDRIIKENIKKQKVKEDKIQHDLENRQRKEQARRAELALRNQQVKKANRMKFELQGKKNKVRQVEGQEIILKSTTGQHMPRGNADKSCDSSGIQATGLSGLSEFRRIGSVQRYGGKRDDSANAQQTSNTRTNIYAQRLSQERGQRLLSGASKGSRGGGSAKSGGSRVLSTNAKSGISGAQGLSSQLYLQDQRGHRLPNQQSAHAGGKKDSVNSTMNMQQSQQVMSNQTGDIGLQTSQRFDSSILLGMIQSLDNTNNNEGIQEQMSQEDSLIETDQEDTRRFELDVERQDPASSRQRGKRQVQKNFGHNMIPPSYDKMHLKKGSLKSLESEIQKISFQNTKNINQLLREEQQNDKLAELFGNGNMRSQKQLPKSYINGPDSSMLGIVNQTFSHKISRQNAAGASSQVKNRKRSQLNIGSSSSAIGGLGSLSLGLQQKSMVQNTVISHNNGLDFLDIKKEIKDELKQVDRKFKEEKRYQNRYDNTMIILNDQSVQDLRADKGLQSFQYQKMKDPVQKSLSPIEGRQREQQLNSHSALPGMSQQAKRHRNKDKKALVTSHGGCSNNNLNLNHLFLNESSSVQQLSNSHFEDPKMQLLALQSSNAQLPPTSQKSKNQQKAIQKFIKAKQQEREQKVEKRQRQELSKMLKTQENLSKLDFFVKKKFQNSVAQHHNNLSSNSISDPSFIKNQLRDKQKQQNLNISKDKREQEYLQKELDQLLLRNLEQTHQKYQDLQEGYKENIFTDPNALPGKPRNLPKGQNKQLSKKHGQKSGSGVDFDYKIGKMLEKSSKQRRRESSIGSTGLKEGRERISGQSIDNIIHNSSPNIKHKSMSGNLRQSQHVMQSIHDIVSRSKSQQRQTGPILHPTSPVIFSRKMQGGPTNIVIANTTKNIMTIENQPSQEIEFFKKEKPKKQLKSKKRSISRGRQAGQSNSYNLGKNANLNTKNNSKSKSRSKSNKSRNQKIPSRERNSKSKEIKVSRSHKSPLGKSNSRSKSSHKKSKRGSSKSKSVSLTRSNQADANYSRIQSSLRQLARNATRLNNKLKEKMKKNRNSLSPKIQEHASNSLTQNIITRNHKADQLHTDFDYNRFMHGTIKISPSTTKLNQYVRNNKSLKSETQVRQRRRNRSQARTSNNMHPCPLRSRPLNGTDKPKSQQNLLSAERLSLERSSSNLKVRPQQSRNKGTLTVDPKEVQKNIGKAVRKVRVEKQQIQAILRKINFDAQKKKGKKKSNKGQKQPGPKGPEEKVHLAVDNSCININAGSGVDSNPQNDLSGTSLLAARKMLSPQPVASGSKQIAGESSMAKKGNQASQSFAASRSNEKRPHSSSQTRAGNQFQQVQLGDRQSRAPLPALYTSDKDKQKQLKELLTSIYKKNEQLIKQNVHKGANPAGSKQKHFSIQSEQRQASSSLHSSSNKQNKMAKYSEEKWVEVKAERPSGPENFKISSRQQQNMGNNAQVVKSHRFSEQSNNFTFFDKNGQNTSSKQGDIVPSQKSHRSNSNLQAQEEEAKKLQKLYLNNLDINEHSSYQSMKYNDLLNNFSIANQNNQHRAGQAKSDVKDQKYLHQQQNMEFVQSELNVEQANQDTRMQRAGGASSRGIQSGRSGILVQLNEIASSGGLRLDNEALYHKMVENNLQPPFTAIESHRSLSSSNTFNLNQLNQDLSSHLSRQKKAALIQQQLNQLMPSPGQHRLNEHAIPASSKQFYTQGDLSDLNLQSQIFDEIEVNQHFQERHQVQIEENRQHLPQRETRSPARQPSGSHQESGEELHRVRKPKDLRANFNIDLEEELQEEQFYGHFSEEQSQQKRKQMQATQAQARNRVKNVQEQSGGDDDEDGGQEQVYAAQHNEIYILNEDQNLITVQQDDEQSETSHSGNEEPDDEDMEVLQRISQINIEKEKDSLSMPMSGGHLSNSLKQNNHSGSNASQYRLKIKLQTMGSNSVPQSLISLNTHNSQKLSAEGPNHSHDEDGSQSGEEGERGQHPEFGERQTRQRQLGPERSEQASGLLEAELQTINKTEGDAENGPTTLISHLNDPNHDVITYNEDEDSRETIGPRLVTHNQTAAQFSESVNQQISPLETYVLNPTENLTAIQSQSVSVHDITNQNSVDNNQMAAENLMKYLENKWNEKKQESSSLFDHSRASIGSDVKQKQSQNTSLQLNAGQPSLKAQEPDSGRPTQSYKVEEAQQRSSKEHTNSSGSENSVIDHDSIQIMVDQNSKLRSPDAETKPVNQSREDGEEQAQASQRSSPAELDQKAGLENEGASQKDVDTKEGYLEEPGEALDDQESSPAGKTADKKANELDQYLDDDIAETSPGLDPERQQSKVVNIEKQVQAMDIEEYVQANQSSGKLLQVRAQNHPEMIITSNLTTLNLDGENSSSDGGAPHGPSYINMPTNSLDEDEIQQLKDKKYIDQFRKRQNRLTSQDPDHSIELNQIEIEIQENSGPASPQQTQSMQVGLEPAQRGADDHQNQTDLMSQVLQEKQPGQNIKISDILRQKEDDEREGDATRICRQLLEDILELVTTPQSATGQLPETQKQSVEEFHEGLYAGSGRENVDLALHAQLAKPLTPQDVYSFISNSINQSELKSQIKQLIEMKQRGQIESDLYQTDDYLNEILQYLLQFEFLTQHQLAGDENVEEVKAMLEELGGINYLVIFLQNLTQPIARDLVLQLKQYATQELGSYEHFESVSDPLKHPILPIDIYLDVEKHREFEFQMSKGKPLASNIKNYISGHSASSVNTVSIVQESLHILNKSIFDAMNESLTKFRPYGVVGEPLPWSNKFRRLQTDVDINSVDTERLVQMVKQEIFRWMSIQQGHLLHSHDAVFQYIDLQIPLMPELQHRLSSLPEEEDSASQDKKKEIIKLDSQSEQKVEDKKEGNEEGKENLEEALAPPPGEKEQPSSPEKQEVIDLKSLASKKQITDIQEEQFLKFKKNLIDEATQELRQAKLASQLQHEILEDEHFWLNYEFEESQIRVDLADLVMDELLKETTDFLIQKDASLRKEAEVR